MRASGLSFQERRGNAAEDFVIDGVELKKLKELFANHTTICSMHAQCEDKADEMHAARKAHRSIEGQHGLQAVITHAKLFPTLYLPNGRSCGKMGA